ncbi:MAG: GSU2403 family nucleotidyltransferase fold protein, partial [Beijerinckiaceae bacterium]
MQSLNADQRRETVNARQRHEAYVEARARLRRTRGSMVWSDTKGISYLLHSFYDDQGGPRRQKSLGPRSDATEAILAAFEKSRDEARDRHDAAKAALTRQAAINRALGLGRVPSLAGRILRMLEQTGLLGAQLRIVGTHALYAYEAAAGAMFDAGLAATQDIDLLFDSRRALCLVAREGLVESGLPQLLKRVDRSFERTRQTFRAVNDEGYAVDLIKPMRDPPRRADRNTLSADMEDLTAVEINGLIWLENAPAFDAVAIDETGMPCRISTVDPRVFAAHKLWVSCQLDRNPVQKDRDAAQARAVAALTREAFPHLPFVVEELSVLPRAVVEAAAGL